MSLEMEALRKFKKGQAEHGEAWSADVINAPAEAANECLDLFNYAELLPEPLRSEIRVVVRDLFEKLAALRDAAPPPSASGTANH